MTTKHTQTHYRILSLITSKYHNLPEKVVQDITDDFKRRFNLDIQHEWIIPVPAKYFKFNPETGYDTEWPIEISTTAPTWFHNLMEGDVITDISSETITKLIRDYNLRDKIDYLIPHGVPNPVILLSKSASENQVLHSELLFRQATIKPNRVTNTFGQNVFQYIEGMMSNSPEAKQILDYFNDPNNLTLKTQYINSAFSVAYINSPVVPTVVPPAIPIIEHIKQTASSRIFERSPMYSDLSKCSIKDFFMIESGTPLIVGVNEYRLQPFQAFGIIRTVWGETNAVLTKLTKNYHNT